MKHLSYKIYLTILACLLGVVLASGVFWRRAGDPFPARQAFELAGELAATALAPADAAQDAQDGSLRRLADRLRLDLALFDSARRPVASAARRPLPPPPPNRDQGGWMFGQGGGPAWAIALPDGRWLVARPPPRPNALAPPLRFVVFIGLVAAVVGLLAWPVVRGLTRRLERLQRGVETLGLGDLTARVDVRGRDEVARLAGSFNRSAERIEALVRAQKMLLANASHELRTPLSRIRIGLELAENADPARKAALERDIAELDGLIEEILLMSRLDSIPELEAAEPVDLLALAAEEAARYEGVDVSGSPVTAHGDARLLRRLIRNLLENAFRHGEPPVTVEVKVDGGEATLSVSDGGSGVPAADRERVFEPFARASGRTRDGERSTGFGVGLALVRQIARRHGGDAVIDPERANRVLVRLPVASAGT